MWPFVAALRLLFLVRLVLDRRNDDFIDLRLGVLTPPVFIHVVQLADGTLFNWALGSAVGVLARRLALVLGRRVGTEVAAADATAAAAARRRSALGRPRAEAAGTGRRAPAGEAARPTRTATAAGATGTPRARRTILPRSGLTDRQWPPLERLLVEPADRFLRHFTVGVVDERKAARPSGFPVGR